MKFVFEAVFPLRMILDNSKQFVCLLGSHLQWADSPCATHCTHRTPHLLHTTHSAVPYVVCRGKECIIEQRRSGVCTSHPSPRASSSPVPSRTEAWVRCVCLWQLLHRHDLKPTELDGHTLPAVQFAPGSITGLRHASVNFAGINCSLDLFAGEFSVDTHSAAHLSYFCAIFVPFLSLSTECWPLAGGLLVATQRGHPRARVCCTLRVRAHGLVNHSV